MPGVHDFKFDGRSAVKIYNEKKDLMKIGLSQL